MPVRKQTLPSVTQLLADNAAFQRMSESQRAAIVQQVNQLPLRLSQTFIQLLEKKRARRAQKSAASKARKGQRQAFGLQAGVAAAGGALGGAVLGGAGALGADIGAGGGAALGAGLGLSGQAISPFLNPGVTVPGGVADKSFTFSTPGAFDPLSAGLLQDSPGAFTPAPLTPAIGVPGGRFPPESFSGLRPVLPKGKSTSQKATSPRAAVSDVSFRLEQLRDLGKKSLAAGDLDRARQLAEFLAELEVA